MSVIGSNILAGASGQGGGYNLTKSLRFRSSATAYLNRTGSTATNAKLATYSFWFKRGILTTGQWLFTGGTTTTLIGFNDSSDALSVLGSDTSGEGNITTAVFRDPSAWYHVVIAIDTSQATTADRAKIYVNGVLQAVTVSNGGITLNSNWGFNTAGSLTIGRYSPSPSSYTDGYLTEVNFIDGQALTPSSFGETSTTTGVWIPKKYTGTYGTNGFYLPFTDTTSTSTLGTDFSGNSNTWTVNNISLTSGSTYDSMTDVPTLTSATTANYCVLNPLDKGGTVNPKNGNLGFANTAGTYNIVRSTVGITSGKWYFEYTIVNSAAISGGSTSAGLVRYDSVLAGKYLGQDTNTLGSVLSGTPSLLLYNGTNKALSSGLNSFSVGAVIQYAYDADAGKLWVGVNNSWDGGNNPSTGSTPTLSSGFAGSSGPWFFAANGLTSPDDVAVNFGQRPFAYTPPTGFVALNTFNLPTPTIGATASTTANKYFDATLYTGNNSTNNIVNSGSMQPDMLWIKGRSQSSNHTIQDSVRGVNRYLLPNLTGSEGTDGCVTAFNSNGFSLTTDAGVSFNANGTTYVGWQWRASNATAVTNTAGSITSTVSANTTAGFSIVTYTGTGANATVGHGLGVAPSMIIVKRRDAGGSGWSVYFITLPAGYVLSLQSTNAQANSSGRFTTTLPTSSVFSVGTDSDLNGSGGTYVAYCFAQIAGYSAFGSYTGNGSTDGTFVYTGFRPKFVLIRRTDSGNNWFILDTSRNTYNLANNQLYPNDSAAEGTNTDCNIDMLSNGFKLRTALDASNGSGGTYIYMAFAENPFKYANAR